MHAKLNRREFLAHSAVASAATSIAAGALNLSAGPVTSPSASKTAPTMPRGRIGKLSISRLISGGNLISGWAHSRDLHYVPSLMRHYNTDEKVMETLQVLEEHGVNTIIADPSERPYRIFGKYWKERGGKIQWIAEGHPSADDFKTDIRKSIDFGACAVYVQGVIGDRWLKEGRPDRLGDCVQFIKSHRIPGGIGAHKLDVIVKSEQSNYGADFYVKTLHHQKYWSAPRPDQSLDVVDNPADNYWETEPEKTIGFMEEVAKPWIAFKVLAAGAIRPESGFRYALENGADFVCVGMFDFQVEQNVQLVKSTLPGVQNRARAWQA